MDSCRKNHIKIYLSYGYSQVIGKRMLNVLPTANLSRTVPYTSLFKSFGIEVQGVLPEIVKCPVCHEHRMIVYADPNSYEESGTWTYCKNCKFCGDTIELYCEVHKIDDIREAIRKLISKRLCLVPQELELTYLVETYINTSIKNRKLVQQAWEKYRSSMQTPLADVKDYLAGNNLMLNSARPGDMEVLNHIGCATIKEIRKFTGRMDIPKRGLAHSIVLPFHDVPGRVSKFRYSSVSRTYHQSIKTTERSNSDGGIAFLDTLELNEDTILAFDDHVIALKLIRNFGNDLDRKRIKIIAYNEDTSTTWKLVRANKVIFYTQYITAELFSHLKAVQNAYITLLPNLDDLEHYIQEYTSSYVANAIAVKAKPWKKFFVDWVLNPDVDDTDISAVTSKLQLLPKDRIELEALCSASKRPLFNTKLGKQMITGIVYVGRSTVESREDGWYDVTRKGVEAVICDSPFVIDYIIIDERTKNKYYAGKIFYKGNEIPFFNEEKDIIGNAIAWLRNTLLEAKIGYPIVHKDWKASLIAISTQLYGSPRIVSKSKRMGFNENTKEIVFPKFTLKNGQFYGDDTPFVGSNTLPAATMLPPRNAAIDNPTIFQPSNNSMCFHLAALAATLSNYLAPLRGTVTRPIALVGAPGSIARIVGRKTAEVLGASTLITRTKGEMVEAREKVLDINYPWYIEPQTHGLLLDWPIDAVDNVMMSVERRHVEHRGGYIKLRGNFTLFGRPSKPRFQPTQTRTPVYQHS